MLANNMIMGIIFLFQTGIGILGNSLLFFVYIYIFAKCPPQKKPLDIIFLHLSVTNIITLCSKLILMAADFFGITNSLNNYWCKVLSFLYRQSRGLSLCTTCLLSVAQALTISPNKYRWTWLKDRIHQNTMVFLLLFWVINSLIYIRLLFFIDSVKDYNVTSKFLMKMCPITPHMNNAVTFFNMSIITIRDFFFLILMSLASGYIMVFLHRHQKNTQYLHKNNFTSRTSHETKASRTVLFLMLCFVIFYLTNSCHSFYISITKKKHQLLETISDVFSICYPAFCPFLIIARESRVLSLNFLVMMWRSILNLQNLSK